MKYLVGIACIAFVIADLFIKINPYIRYTILGLMSLFVIGYLLINRKDENLDSMFNKNSDKQKKSIFDVKDLFKK